MKMNIQFMEKTVTIKDSRTGKDIIQYVPDFDELAKNASCEEEVEAIRETEKKFAEWTEKGLLNLASFPFQIVYLEYRRTLKQNFKTNEMKWVNEWQILQHPWYQAEGKKYTKEQMIEIIEAY